MEPAFCLSIWQGSLQGTEQESQVPRSQRTCLPAEAGQLPHAKAGHLAAPQEWGLQAAGRLWERDSLCSQSPGPKEQTAET